MTTRPGQLAHTVHGEPLARTFFEDTGQFEGVPMDPRVHGDGAVYYRTGNATGDRNLLLMREGARAGMRWFIGRTSASIGLGVLVPINEDFSQVTFLASGDWVEAVFNGTVWVAISRGAGL